MPTPDEVQMQQELLVTHRRTLSLYLSQLAIHGTAHVPPSVLHGIYEARLNIQRIKKILRSWNISVDDQPDDEDAPPLKEGESETVTLATDPWLDPIVKCRGYTFLHNSGTLAVWTPGAAPNQQLRYDISTLPWGEWYGLGDGKGTQLPLAFVNNTGQLQVRVNAQPETNLRMLIPIGASTQIIHLFSNYDHPVNGFRVFRIHPDKEILTVRNPVTQQTFDVDVSRIGNGQWITLRDPQKRELPIAIGREQGKLVLKWL